MKFSVVYSRESEHQRLEFTLGKLDFYEQKGHRVNLPEGIAPEASIVEVLAAADGTFPGQIVLAAKEQLLTDLRKHTEQIARYIASLPFKAPSEVKLVLTQFGAGGSYNVAATEIIINVNYSVDLLSLLVHEVTHLIVDEPLVTKFNLNHEAKENLIKWLLSNSSVLKSFIKIPTKDPIQAPNKNVLDELERLGYVPA